MSESHELLAEYARNGTESAFRELVARYIDFVYSTALRKVGGDAHLAHDVAQTVFLDLARKAPKMHKHVMLGGWLHQATCNAAATFTRGEHRRRARERQAVQMNTLDNGSPSQLDLVAPVLDDAIGQLPDEDRTAVLLRFFEKRDFRAVGERLGISEDAARMRVNRALEKLLLLLKRQDVTISAAALLTGLSAEAVSAAPAGLAMTVAGTALAGAAGTGTALTLLKIVTMSKLKLGILGTAVVVGATVPVVISHQTQSRLREENESLRQQVTQLSQVASASERPSNGAAQPQSSQILATEQASELLRLRGEVGLLRQEKTEWDRKKAALAANRTREPDDNGGTAPAAGVEVLPAGAMRFFQVDLGRVLEIYGEVAKSQLDIEEAVRSLPVMINFTNAEAVTRTELIRLLDNALLEQAGIIVTHPETNRVAVRLQRDANAAR